MKAIVYTSQTGHTQRYAQMLAERTGVPAYSLKEAGKSLRRGEEIFYMGWLMAGTVKGLQSAMDRYTIRGAAIVGVSPQGNGDLWTEARINGGYSDSGGMAEIFQHGGDFVREEALDEIVRWFREGPHDGEVKAVPSVDI